MKSTAFVAAFLLPFCVIAAESNRNVIARGNYANSQLQFEKNKTGRVAFMGGSITQMNGYRPMVSVWLAKRFPKTKFEFVDAGISSTCSTTGAFRLKSHVLDKGQIDLFFIEFAVNDDQDAGHARRECIRGMEGIIRQARTAQPNMDIVVTHFVNPGMLELLRAGNMPLPMAAHEKVLKAYNVSTIFLAREVADRIDAGKLTWKVFGGTHPKPAGNAIAAGMIDQLLTAAWERPLGNKPEPHSVPKAVLDSGSYFNGHFVSPAKSSSDAWTWHVPDWKKIPGGFRSNPFDGMKLLTAEKPGKETILKFKGRALGAYVLAGPDAGTLEVSIDESDWKRVDLYHHYSRGLNYPRTVMFTADLKRGAHTAKIRLSEKSNPKSMGTAARILQFTVN
ncbi:MAG: SGNH/GDSL hydrolase family protein [Verrucomicrobiota bacterium]|jgi:lysophospholipase L1-like esterase|nr:SGNH/GDSL hydrolase family protein [Verrucomicrobiota bacterium]